MAKGIKGYFCFFLMSLMVVDADAFTIASKCIADLAKLNNNCIANYRQRLRRRNYTKERMEKIKLKCEDLMIKQAYKCTQRGDELSNGLSGCDVSPPPIANATPAFSANPISVKCWERFSKQSRLCKKKIKRYQATRNYKRHQRAMLLKQCLSKPLARLKNCAKRIITSPLKRPPMGRLIYDVNPPWTDNVRLMQGDKVWVCWERARGGPKWYRGTFVNRQYDNRVCIKLRRSRTKLCTVRHHVYAINSLRLKYPTKAARIATKIRQRILMLFNENHGMLKQLALKVKSAKSTKHLNSLKQLGLTVSDQRQALKQSQLQQGNLILDFKPSYVGSPLKLALIPIPRFKDDEVFYNCKVLTRNFNKRNLPDICKYPAHPLHYQYAD